MQSANQLKDSNWVQVKVYAAEHLGLDHESDDGCEDNNEADATASMRANISIDWYVCLLLTSRISDLSDTRNLFQRYLWKRMVTVHDNTPPACRLAGVQYQSSSSVIPYREIKFRFQSRFQPS